MTINNICKHRCDDPACKELGCLNQPGWKFRDDILFADQHKKKMLEDINMDDDNMAEFLLYLQQQVAAKRDSAAFGGSMNDGGASRLEEQVEVYRAGTSNRIPDTWTIYYRQFMNERDPDYKKYLMLKDKFES